MAFETTHERLAIRDKLVAALLETPIGATLSHANIAVIIGKKTTSPDAIKYQAINIAAKEHGVVFENVRGEGYRRIEAGEAHRIGVKARSSIRGHARRGCAKITAVLSSNSNSMGTRDKIKAHSELALLGMIRMAAGQASANKAHAEADKAYKRRQKPPTIDAIAKALLTAKASTT